MKASRDASISPAAADGRHKSSKHLRQAIRNSRKLVVTCRSKRHFTSSSLIPWQWKASEKNQSIPDRIVSAIYSASCLGGFSPKSNRNLWKSQLTRIEIRKSSRSFGDSNSSSVVAIIQIGR